MSNQQYNRWHVYEWIKENYMFSGRIPTIDQVNSQFSGSDPEEIREGCIEFTITTKKVVWCIKGA